MSRTKQLLILGFLSLISLSVSGGDPENLGTGLVCSLTWAMT